MQVRPASALVGSGGVPRVVGSAKTPPAGVDPGFALPAIADTRAAGLRTADQVDFSADAKLLAAGLQAERDGMVLDVVDRSLESSRQRREEAQARAAERRADEQRAAEADALRDARLAQAEEAAARREARLEESIQRDARYEQMLAEQGAVATGSLIDVTG